MADPSGAQSSTLTRGFFSSSLSSARICFRAPSATLTTYQHLLLVTMSVGPVAAERAGGENDSAVWVSLGFSSGVMTGFGSGVAAGVGLGVGRGFRLRHAILRFRRIEAPHEHFTLLRIREGADRRRSSEASGLSRPSPESGSSAVRRRECNARNLILRAADDVVIRLLGHVLLHDKRGLIARQLKAGGFRSGMRSVTTLVVTSISATLRHRFSRESASQSRNGFFDDCTTIGPSVSALNFAAASCSRAGVRMDTTTRDPSSVQSRLAWAAMRFVLFTATADSGPVDGPAITETTGRSLRLRASRRNDDCQPLAVARKFGLAHIHQAIAQRQAPLAGLGVDHDEPNRGRRDERRIAVAVVVGFRVVDACGAR